MRKVGHLWVEMDIDEHNEIQVIKIWKGSSMY